MDFILPILLFLILGVVVVLLLRSNKDTSKGEDSGPYKIQIAQLETSLSEARQNLEKRERELSEAVEKMQKTQLELSTSKANEENLKVRFAEEQKRMEALKKEMTLQFENLANEVLKTNREELNKANQEKLGQLLEPLKTQIKDFKEKVEKSDKDSIERITGLKTELEGLQKLNHKLSEDAQSLAKALKGDTKKQGEWGELVLERVLEASGLEKGKEYETQSTDYNEDGRLIRPDVIVYLPDNKHIIVDSKVSLTAYTEYVNEEDEEVRERKFTEHVLSFKNHIKELADKSYQTGKSLDTPDFVLMFVPIESSFSAVVNHDPSVFDTAWEKKVVLVTPSTLLATLKTVASIWKHEKQSKNVQQIASEGSKLYGKFVGFVKTLENIGRALDRSKVEYDKAMNQLNTGKGNLVSRAEKIRQLGGIDAPTLTSSEEEQIIPEDQSESEVEN